MAAVRQFSCRAAAAVQQAGFVAEWEVIVVKAESFLPQGCLPEADRWHRRVEMAIGPGKQSRKRVGSGDWHRQALMSLGRASENGLAEDRLHRIFQIGAVLKGLHAVIEIGSGTLSMSSVPKPSSGWLRS